MFLGPRFLPNFLSASNNRSDGTLQNSSVQLFRPRPMTPLIFSPTWEISPVREAVTSAREAVTSAEHRRFKRGRGVDFIDLSQDCIMVQRYTIRPHLPGF